MDADMRTHKNENSVSIFLPALNHLVVFIICSLGVHREERTGAVTEVELPMQWRIRCRLRMNDVLIRYEIVKLVRKVEAATVTHAWPRVATLQISVTSLRHY
jgi:hypothetical protein